MPISPDELQFAGEFKIEVAKLHAEATSKVIDLKKNASVLTLKIFEDIRQPDISGEMILSTTHAYADQLPILGQEKLELVLKTPEFDEKFDFSAPWRWFDVYSVKQRTHSGNLQTIIIKFISPESLINARTMISESIQGTYAEIVEKVMYDNVGTKKTLDVEETEGHKNMVIANKHPFDVIGQATAHSISIDKKLPAYRFFENSNGFHFKSVSSMFKQPSIWKFGVNSEGLKQQGSGDSDIIKDLQSFTKMVLKQNDLLMDIEQGVMGAKLLVHDIFNKQYTYRGYSYFDSFAEEEHVGHPNSKSIYKVIDEDIDWSQSKLYYQPVSIKKKGQQDINGLFSTYSLPRPIDDIKIAQKNSQLNQLDQAFQIECEALGTTKLTVGNMVDIMIPKATEDVMMQVAPDELFHGKFLIAALRHTFEPPNHTATMTLVRDSLPQGLPQGF